MQAQGIDPTDVITRLLGGAGSFGPEVKSWELRTRNIGSTNLILGHPIQGVIGSIPGYTLGSDGAGAFGLIASGGLYA